MNGLQLPRELLSPRVEVTWISALAGKTIGMPSSPPPNSGMTHVRMGGRLGKGRWRTFLDSGSRPGLRAAARALGPRGFVTPDVLLDGGAGHGFTDQVDW